MACDLCSPPAISIVVGARNDNYGGELLHRMQVFVDALLEQWNVFALHAELIVVEWNPPRDRKRLWEELVWPRKIESGKVRFLEVPNEIHQLYPNSDKIPHFEYLAKNAGIRRAEGGFILATNPDLIFSNEIIEYMAEGKLSRDCFYRTDRYDVDSQVPLQCALEGKLDFCRKNCFRFHRHNETINLLPHRKLADKLEESKNRQLMRTGLEPRKERVLDLEDVHTNASGDFLLMAKEAWFDLHGYPGVFTHSHIDSMMCWMAATLSLRQAIMRRPMRIFHQEHDRTAHTQRPLTEYLPLKERIQDSMATGTPFVFNGEEWGLGGVSLEEKHIIEGPK